MNTIKRFLIKKFFKMDKKEKLALLMLVYAHYGNFKLEAKDDIDRNEAVIEEIDHLVDELRKDFNTKLIVSKVEVKPSTAPVEQSRDKTDAKKVEPAKVESTKMEIPKEALVLVKPYYDCSVLQKEGVDPKKIKFDDCKLELPAFVDDKIAKKYTGKDGKPVYLTVEELELVLDDAWDMASEGKSNKEIGEFLQKNIGAFYAKNGLKQDGDYYKISNPYSKLVKILRRGLGAGYDDTKVSTTRPSYTLFTESDGNITMSADKDCSKSAAVETTKKPEVKPEMKNVQTQKTDGKKVEPAKIEPKKEPVKTEPVKAESTKVEEIPADEEVQETETTDTAEELATAKAAEVGDDEKEETPEVEDGKAPTVNEFDSFNDIEKLIFEKLKAGNLKASKEKDIAIQKNIKAEAREDAKLLIQSRFDADEWAQKDEKGFWQPEFLNYWNTIVKEIGTRANVVTK